MIYYFVEFAGSFANIALLVLFVDRLFQKKDLSSRWFYLYIALLIVGQCLLSLFPTWVMPRTIYFLLGGFLLAILFYEAQIWQAIFASAAFFTLVAVVEVLAMLLMGLQVSDTDALISDLKSVRKYIDMVLNKQQLFAPGGKTPEKESVLKKLEQFQQKKSHHKTTSTPPNREESL